MLEIDGSELVMLQVFVKTELSPILVPFSQLSITALNLIVAEFTEFL